MKNVYSLAQSIARAKLKGIPYKLNYAVTYQCNSKCKICNIWKRYTISPEDQKNELTLSEIDSIFSDFDLTWISFTGGEPFLRKDLADIALTVRKHNPHLHMVSIPTNGFLTKTILTTTERILEESSIPNVMVTVSLDGDEKLHDNLRGVKGAWKKARKTYQLLSSIENDRFSVFLEFTVSKFNAGNLLAALDSFGVTDYSHVVLTAAHSSYFYGTDQEDLHEDSSASQVKEFLSLCNYSLIEGIIPLVYTKLLEKNLKGIPFSVNCVSGRSSFFLDPYGVLYPCISMEEPLGNLKESRLQEILQGEKARSVVQRIKEGKCPGCWTPCEAYQTILENLPKAVAAAFLK